MFLLVFLTYIVYERVIKPYQTYSFYKKVLCENYRTEVQPFTIVGMGFAKNREKDMKEHGDTHYSAKTTLTKYQVRLMKVGSKVNIDLLDADLIKEYYERTKEKCYEKSLSLPGISSLK